MIEVTFKEFYELEYKEDGLHELYVVKNGLNETLYVGITSQKIWDRWFGWNGHIFLSGAILEGRSSIGCRIVDHLPDSWVWKVQLWTLDNCMVFCKDEISSTRRSYDIKYLERFMIEKLRPALNVTYNLNPGAENTPKSEKEKARETELDRIYNEVFEKRPKKSAD